MIATPRIPSTTFPQRAATGRAAPVAPALPLVERERLVLDAIRAALRDPRNEGLDLRHLVCVEVLVSEEGLASLRGLHPDIARKALAQCEAVLRDTSPPALADFLYDLHRRARGLEVAGAPAPKAASSAAQRASLSAHDLEALERLLADGDPQARGRDADRRDPATEQPDFARSDFMPGRKFQVAEVDRVEFDALLASGTGATRTGSDRRAPAHARSARA